MAEDPRNKQSSLWVTASVAFIIMVMATYVMDRYLGFTITESIFGDSESVEGMAEGSLQPAVDACKRAARVQIGASLLSAKMDARSTRYLSATQEYLVFLNLMIQGSERLDYTYECNVSAVNQQILRTRVNGPPGSFQQIQIR